MPGSSGKTSIARKQRSVERLGESDINGIIGGKIVSQLPNARQEEIVRISMQGKVGEVGESRTTAFAINLTICRIPAEHLRDLEIEQMRNMQRLARLE
jgi:hypothetical protein